MSRLRDLGLFAFTLGVLAACYFVATMDNRIDTSNAPPLRVVEPPKPAATTRVAFIGDSYTAGAGGTEGGFVTILGDSQGWVVENLGRGGTGYLVNQTQDPKASLAGCGEEYCPNYPEVIDEAASFKPDIVIVSGGRNNYAAETADLRRGISTFFRKLRREVPNAAIWATSPLHDDDPAPATLGEIGAIVRQAVEDVDGDYLDLGQPLEGHPEWLADDGVHPNDAGYAEIAEVIRKRLPTWVTQKRSDGAGPAND